MIPLETQRPTEQERQLASKASLAFFTKKSYVEALAWLENLSSLRPHDPRVSGKILGLANLGKSLRLGLARLGKVRLDKVRLV